MATIKDIKEAFQSFTDGINAVSAQRAISQANEQVQIIRAQEEDAAQQRLQLQQVAANLGLELGQAAAAPGDITAAQRSVLASAPPEEVRFKSAEEAILSAPEDSPIRDIAQDLIETKAATKREGKEELRTERNLKNIRAELNVFDRRSDVKILRESRQAVFGVRNLLKAARDPKAAQFAANELAKIGLVKASGESGRLSDQDIMRAAGNPSLFRKVKRFLAKGFTGTPTQKDIEEAEVLVGVLEDALVEAEKRKARTFAQQRSKFLPGIKPEDFADAVAAGIDPGPDSPASSKNVPQVKVISPDGVKGTIPVTQLKDALKKGFKEIK